MILRAERKREREALLSSGDADSGVGVKQANVRNNHACRGGLNDAFQVGGGYARVDHDREVALRGGEAGQGHKALVRIAHGGKSANVQFGNVDASVGFPTVGNVRMQLAKQAEHGSVRSNNLCRAAGLQVACGARAIALAGNAKNAEQLFQNALELVEARGLVAKDDADLLTLLRQIRAGVHMRIAHLEEAQMLALAVRVANERVEHAGNQRGAHQALILTEWVENANGFSQLAALRQQQRVEDGRTREIVVVHFVEAQRRERVLDLILQQEHLVDLPAEGVPAHQRRLNVVVAVDTRNLLGNVPVRFNSAFDVRAEMRYGHVQPAKRRACVDADGREHVRHLFGGEVEREQRVDVLYADGDLAIHRLFLADVDDLADDRACLQLCDELDGAFQRKLRADGLHALDEAARRIGHVLELARGRADVAALEHGGLKEHRLGRIRDFGVQPAHDARDADAAFVVRNQQHVRRDGAILLVQRGDDLVFVGIPNDDVAAGDAGEVKRVHRVTVFHQHIVRNVDNVVDRAQADALEFLLHPGGRGFDDDVLDDARGVARAKVVVFNRNARIVRGVAFALDRLDLRLREGLSQRGGGLAAHAKDADAVRAVRRELKLEDLVVKAERRVDCLPERMILFENQDAVHLAAGVIRIGQSKLRAGAEHAVAHDPAHVDGGHLASAEFGADDGDGNQRPVEDVVRAGDDGQHLGTDVHLANVQMIGIFVLDDGEHAADDNAFHAGELLFHTRAFKPAPHHLFDELGVGDVQVYVFFEPFLWQFHIRFLP